MDLAKTKAKTLEAMTCPQGKAQAFVWDDHLKGFGLRITAAGARSWVANYRAADGTQRRMTLGSLAELSPDRAHKLARERLGAVAGGADPLAEGREARRRERRRLDSVLDAYEASLTARRVVNGTTIMSTLRRGLKPLLAKDMAEIRRADVARQVAALEKAGKPGAATDLRAKASVLWNWAVNEGQIDASPLAGWRRPRATRAERVEQAEHGRALTDAEIGALWKATAEMPDAVTRGLARVALLTGLRRSELGRARWRDVDLTPGTWTIPPQNSKNGRPFVLTLPALALAELRALPRVAKCPFVFAGRNGRQVSGWSQRIEDLRECLTAAGITDAGAIGWHDLRRTFRTGLARLGVPEGVAEAALNHLAPVLVQAYQRHDHAPERAEALARWAAHVAGLAAPRENVVALRTA